MTKHELRSGINKEFDEAVDTMRKRLFPRKAIGVRTVQGIDINYVTRFELAQARAAVMEKWLQEVATGARSPESLRGFFATKQSEVRFLKAKGRLKDLRR